MFLKTSENKIMTMAEVKVLKQRSEFMLLGRDRKLLCCASKI